MHKGACSRAARVAARRLAGAVFLISACAASDAPYEGSAQQHADVAQMQTAMPASADAWNRGDQAGHPALESGA